MYVIKSMEEQPKLAKLPGTQPKKIKWLPLILFVVLLLLWTTASKWLHHVDGTAAGVDQSIWLLVILSMLAFLLMASLCKWLLDRFWILAGLPPLSIMVSQFHTLNLCQQLGFYWACFAALLLAASICLGGIC